MLVLLLRHVLKNRWWWRLRQEKSDSRHLFSTIVTLLLAADVLVLAVTSLVIPRNLFGSHVLPGTFQFREIHWFAAWWLVPLAGLHLSLNARRIATFLTLSNLQSRLAAGLVVLIAIQGVSSGEVLELWPRLRFSYSLAMWDFNASIVPYFMHWFAALFVFVAGGLLVDWIMRRRMTKSPYTWPSTISSFRIWRVVSSKISSIFFRRKRKFKSEQIGHVMNFEKKKDVSLPGIGVIGAEWLGGTVGEALAAAGYPVVLSSRHPERLTAGTNLRSGSISDAAACDVVLLAVPHEALIDMAADLRSPLNGKIVIDATNPSRHSDAGAAGGKDGCGRSQSSASAQCLAGATFLCGRCDLHRTGARL
ncbi:NAD(P)-binding domain-containing protein [Breoghania sp.]|uniref:NADPH-dependent F420 reductase n=1 Tax=Breoghania sp. TaxID=2065378 RepID=UPI002607FA2A|nr:NAD(P)-binding domain-containing protein [Breoghania sp.]MDJ0932799.1 NAD(P)-binding domain-containing protein [Breoghania sp.]